MWYNASPAPIVILLAWCQYVQHAINHGFEGSWYQIGSTVQEFCVYIYVDLPMVQILYLTSPVIRPSHFLWFNFSLHTQRLMLQSVPYRFYKQVDSIYVCSYMKKGITKYLLFITNAKKLLLFYWFLINKRFEKYKRLIIYKPSFFCVRISNIQS